jgi:hypothetical protein
MVARPTQLGRVMSDLERTLELEKLLIPEWKEIAKRIVSRRIVLLDEDKALEHFPAHLELSATNVFVEKAQLHLEKQADRYWKWGLFFVFSSIFYVFGSIATYYYFLA